MIDEIGARTGARPAAAAMPLTSDSFSATSCRAMKMSVPQSNSTQTTAMPTAVADRTRRTPDGAVDRAFDRKRDERLHLVGGHAVAFGEDRDRGRGEIREHVDRHVARGPDAGRRAAATDSAMHHPVMVDRPLNQSFHRESASA